MPRVKLDVTLLVSPIPEVLVEKKKKKSSKPYTMTKAESAVRAPNVLRRDARNST